MMNPTFLQLIAVATGGAIGSVARWAVARAMGGWSAQAMQAGRWPWATLVVNVIGCAAMGAFMAWFDRTGPDSRTAWRAFVATGILGGLTTFSAFAWEAESLSRHGSPIHAAGYLLVSVVSGLCAVILGRYLATT